MLPKIQFIKLLTQAMSSSENEIPSQQRYIEFQILNELTKTSGKFDPMQNRNATMQ